MNDLVIGMADGYKWSDLYPFVVSLRRSGYDGQLILINADVPLDKIAKYQISVRHADLNGEYPIVARFRIVPEFIKDDMRYVIACDTSDIVFQSNPFAWLENNLPKGKTLCVASEEVLYRDSEGNRKNMREAYPALYSDMENREVLNAGMIAGVWASVLMLLPEIYDLCRQDLRTSVIGKTWDDMLPDQSAMNFLLADCSFLKIAQSADKFVYEYSYGSQADPEEFAVLHQYLCRWRDKIRERYREA